MKILACMLIFMMLFCGCDAENGKITSTTEGRSTSSSASASGTSGTTSGGIMGGMTTSTTTRSTSTSATTTDAPLFDRTAYFAKSEISHIFENTADSLERLFGKATGDEEFNEGENAYRRMTYGDNVFETDRDGKRIFRATIADDSIEAFRDIRIGDTADEVLAKLPEAKNDDRTALTGEGEKGEYNLLYGNYENMADYGIVVYDGDEISEIRLTESQYGATIYFENEKVSKIEYYSPK